MSLKELKWSEGVSSSGDAAVVEEDYESLKVLMMLSNIDDYYISNSRCFFHIIPKCLWFYEFIKPEGCSILLGDNKSYKIIGVGTIKFHLHDVIEILLEEVRYVPSLK